MVVAVGGCPTQCKREGKCPGGGNVSGICPDPESQSIQTARALSLTRSGAYIVSVQTPELPPIPSPRTPPPLSALQTSLPPICTTPSTTRTGVSQSGDGVMKTVCLLTTSQSQRTSAISESAVDHQRRQ